jgi:alkylation response protein AidB-like acyl-CoA dehydrogenase
LPLHGTRWLHRHNRESGPAPGDEPDFCGSAACSHPRVGRLTRSRGEHIAPRAAEYDAAGANPIDSWRVLARDGFLGSCIPTAHGGLGLDMPTYIGVIRTIARGCANTAMTVHMHSTVMRFIDALGTEAQKRRYFGEVTRDGKLFGAGAAEPAATSHLPDETAVGRQRPQW